MGSTHGQSLTWFFQGLHTYNTVCPDVIICLPDPVHLHSLIPYIPVSHHKSVSGRASGVDRTLSFLQGLAHRRHTVVVGPHATTQVVDCWVVHGFFNMLSFYRNRESTCCPTPYQEDRGCFSYLLRQTAAELKAYSKPCDPHGGLQGLAKIKSGLCETGRLAFFSVSPRIFGSLKWETKTFLKCVPGT